jgi:type II restriction enzyme
MLTGNKGEWSEVYALLRIISDRKLYAGDSDLNKIEKMFFPIIKILRDESNGTFEFAYDNDLVVVKHGKEGFRIPVNEFKTKAFLLLSKLKEKTARTFSIPEIESFLNAYQGVTLKAKSKDKSDIKIEIHDKRVGTSSELGFSIKSQLGSASTLLNAGQTTNFIFKLVGPELTDLQIEEVNQIEGGSKIKDRIEKLRDFSNSLSFVRTESATFGNNLTLIDSMLPKILSEIVYLFYTSKYSKTVDLVNQVAQVNPIGYDIQCNHPFYVYKIKRFLTDIALGMMPAKVWTGTLDATGGYLVIKQDGEIVCYHIYSRNEFEDYLINNTKLETASSSKHVFGTIYKENGELFFNLNLQIRFRK